MSDPANIARTSRGPFAGIVVIGCVAVAAIVALLVWGGGDEPDAVADGGPGGPNPTAPAPPTTTGEGDRPAAAQPASSPPRATTAAPAAATAAPAAPTTADGTLARTLLLQRLPTPTDAVEQDSPPSMRTWIVPKANWIQRRNAYIATLRDDLGLQVSVTDEVDADGVIATVYAVTDPGSGATIEVVVGLKDNQTIFEATR